MNDIKNFLLSLSKYNAILDFGINLSCSKSISKKATVDLFVYPFHETDSNEFQNYEDTIRTASSRYYKQFYSIVEDMNIPANNPALSKKVFNDPSLMHQFFCYIQYLHKQHYINYTADGIKISNNIPFSSCAVLGTIIKITYKKNDKLDITSFRDSFIDELKHVLFKVKINKNQATTFFLYQASIIEMSVFFYDTHFDDEYKLKKLLNHYAYNNPLLRDIIKCEYKKAFYSSSLQFHEYEYPALNKVDEQDTLKERINEIILSHNKSAFQYAKTIEQSFIKNKKITQNESRQKKILESATDCFNNYKAEYDYLFSSDISQEIFSITESIANSKQYCTLPKDTIIEDYHSLFHMLFDELYLSSYKIHTILQDSSILFYDKCEIIREIYFNMPFAYPLEEETKKMTDNVDKILHSFNHVIKIARYNNITIDNSYYYELPYLMKFYYIKYSEFNFGSLHPQNVFREYSYLENDYTNFCIQLHNCKNKTSSEKKTICKSFKEKLSKETYLEIAKKVIKNYKELFSQELDSSNSSVLLTELDNLNNDLDNTLTYLKNAQNALTDIPKIYDINSQLEYLNPENLYNLTNNYNLHYDNISALVQSSETTPDIFSHLKQECTTLINNITASKYYQNNCRQLYTLSKLLDTDLSDIQ